MITFIRSWLTGVTCAALLVSLADSLMPKGAVKQVGRLVCGLVLLWTALRPVLGLGAADLTQEAKRMQDQIAVQQDALEGQNNPMLKTLIERETAAYIVDKAAEMDIQCQAEVVCAAEDGGTWMPWSVQIKGIFSEAQRRQLSQLLETELDIPPQRQEYTGGEQP